MVREHGWSPNILVFGREPRAFGELNSGGNPYAFHPDAGTRDTAVARHVSYRYHARLAYIRHQAKHMLLRTVEQRMRKGEVPQRGQMVFFWREARHRRKQQPASNWVGPGFVVGHQGNNCWISCGGRCYLVATEHVRLAVGDEEQYGIPEAQQAVALFQKGSSDATFEDLTKQKGPSDKDWSMEEVEVNLLEDEENNPEPSSGPQEGEIWTSVDVLTGHLKRVYDMDIGWHRDELGQVVHVGKKQVNFRTPELGFGSGAGKYRTTWIYMTQGKWAGKWTRVENEVDWTLLKNPSGFLPELPCKRAITIFFRIGKEKKSVWTVSPNLFLKSPEASQRRFEGLLL